MNHYCVERLQYPLHCQTFVNHAKVQDILDELTEHFHAPKLTVGRPIRKMRHAYRVTMGSYYPSKGMVRFRRGLISLHTICHEVAHHLAWTRAKDRTHSGPCFRAMNTLTHQFARQYLWEVKR